MANASAIWQQSAPTTYHCRVAVCHMAAKCTYHLSLSYSCSTRAIPKTKTKQKHKYTRELISARNTQHKYNNKDPSRLR